MLSLLILLIYYLFIIAPLVRIKSFENTYFLGLMIFPLYSILFLGPFLLIYVGLRYLDYKNKNFTLSLFYHLLACSIYFLLVGIFMSKDSNFSLKEYFDLILKLLIYFSFHIFLMKYFIKKFKLFKSSSEN